MKNKFFADGLTAEERAKNKKECDNITGDKCDQCKCGHYQFPDCLREFRFQTLY